MPVTRKGYFSLCLLLAIIVVLAMTNIWIRTATVKSAYEYVEQEKDLRKLRQTSQELRVTWLELTSPRALEKHASALALFAPNVNQLLRYEVEREDSKNGR